MRAFFGWLIALAMCGLLAGCVERRFVITSEPQGAIVFDEKGQSLGATPTDRQFTYYGKYRFMLVRDGFQTHVVEERIKAPLHGIFPFDFFSEIVLPFWFRDVRRFHYTLQPAQVVPPEVVLQNGQQLRGQGQLLGFPMVDAVPAQSGFLPVPAMPPAP